jgi:hypothetical protein
MKEKRGRKVGDVDYLISAYYWWTDSYQKWRRNGLGCYIAAICEAAAVILFFLFEFGAHSTVFLFMQLLFVY